MTKELHFILFAENTKKKMPLAEYLPKVKVWAEASISKLQIMRLKDYFVRADQTVDLTFKMLKRKD